MSFSSYYLCNDSPYITMAQFRTIYRERIPSELYDRVEEVWYMWDEPNGGFALDVHIEKVDDETLFKSPPRAAEVSEEVMPRKLKRKIKVRRGQKRRRSQRLIEKTTYY